MEKTFKQGEIIFSEGEQGDCFYDIEAGSVGIYTSYGTDAQKELTRVESGHIIGELALIDQRPRSATAVALSDVTAAEVNKDDLKGYFSEKPEKITFLFSEMGERVSRLTKDISEVREALKEACPKEESGQKPGIMDKIKKFADEYRMAKKNAAVSSESKKSAAFKEGEAGFSKQVDSYHKGEIVFKDGEKARCMYDVQLGWVDIYSGYGTPDEKLITTIGVGSFFGEVGLLSDSERTATAVAGMEGTIIESLVTSDFEEIYTQNPLKIVRMMEYISDRVRRLTDEYLDACAAAYRITEAEGKDVAATVNEYFTGVEKEKADGYAV